VAVQNIERGGRTRTGLLDNNVGEEIVSDGSVVFDLFRFLACNRFQMDYLKCVFLTKTASQEENSKGRDPGLRPVGCGLFATPTYLIRGLVRGSHVCMQ